VNHLLDERVAGEIRRFSLRFTCDACAHADGDDCSLGYPTEPHRRTDALDRVLAFGPEESDRVVLTFCKEFELG
jgi:hypothetical protein